MNFVSSTFYGSECKYLCHKSLRWHDQIYSGFYDSKISHQNLWNLEKSWRFEISYRILELWTPRLEAWFLQCFVPWRSFLPTKKAPVLASWFYWSLLLFSFALHSFLYYCVGNDLLSAVSWLHGRHGNFSDCKHYPIA